MSETLTAAEQYAQIKELNFDTFLESTFSASALKGVELFEVKCPSGMIFKCRRIGQDFIAQSGQMPMALAAQLLTKKDGADLTDKEKEAIAIKVFNDMSPIEQRAAIQAMAQMVRYIAVEPRLLIGEVNGHKNAISVDALTQGDCICLAKFAQGGDKAQMPRTFRRKRK